MSIEELEKKKKKLLITKKRLEELGIDSTNILFRPFPKVNITDKTIENVKKYPRMHERCPVRVRMGKVYTNENMEKYIEESLKRPLPGDSKGRVISFTRKNK